MFNAFSRAGMTLLEMNLKKANLEDIFIELAESPAQNTAADEPHPEEECGEEEKEEDE